MLIQTKFNIGQKVEFVYTSYDYDSRRETIITNKNKIGYIREITTRFNDDGVLVNSYTLTERNEKFPLNYYYAKEKNILKILDN